MAITPAQQKALGSGSALARARAAAGVGILGVQPSKITAGKPAAAPTAPGLDWASLLANDPYGGIVKVLGAIPSLAGLPALARKQALADISPQLLALGLDSQTQQTQLRQQETRASEFAKALAAMNIQAGNQVYGNYADAAKTFGALGQGLTGAVGEDWQTQSDKVNAAVQQMTGGRGPAVGGYDPAAMQNTQGYANVNLPTANLEQQALQAGALTRAGIAANVGSIVDIASQYRAKLADAQAQLVSDKAKLIGQEPSLVQKALDSLKSDRTTQIANLAKMVQARTGWQSNIATLMQRENAQTDQSALNWAKERTSEQSAAAYNTYLTGKSTLSQDELNWKKQYQQAQAAIARANARTGRLNTALRAAGITGTDVKGNVLPGWYQNPKTKAIEKQPPNTYMGKDGMPHYLPGYHGKGATTGKPPGTSVKDLHESMIKGLTDQWHIFDTNIVSAGQARQHSAQEISSFLMRNFGNAYIAQYPELAATVRAQVAAVARAAQGWLKTQAANRKRANAAAAATVTTGGPTG